MGRHSQDISVGNAESIISQIVRSHHSRCKVQDAFCVTVQRKSRKIYVQIDKKEDTAIKISQLLTRRLQG